jgi:hypothetical protein
MKKCILLFMVGLLHFSVYSQTSPKTTCTSGTDSLIFMFRNQTGIRAIAVLDTTIVKAAKLLQKSNNINEDKWVAAKIPRNTNLYGGLPNQCALYSVSKTLKNADTLLIKYWKSLQVESSQISGYRAWVGIYNVKDTIVVAISRTQANPQYGNGGAWQLYVKDYDKHLVLNDTIKLRSSNKYAN